MTTIRTGALGLALLAGLGSATPASAAPSPGPLGAWQQYLTPQDGGFSAELLERAFEAADQARSAAVMVIHQGRVVAAWGDVDRRLKVASVRKSLLSALIGTAVAERRIDLDASVGVLGLDEHQPLTGGEKRARVRDLLTSRSGIYLPAAREPPGMTASRPPRGSQPAGAHFWYNNWDFNALATIYERATGTSVLEAFARRLAGPLAMEDYRATDGFYVREPRKSRHAAYEFPLSARDLARVGQLYLQQGRWGDRQLLPASWVRESTRRHAALATGGGYGYLWWVDAAGWFAPELETSGLSRTHYFAALGMAGHMLLVIPEAALVIVQRGDGDHGRSLSDDTTHRIADLIVQARRGPPRRGAKAAPLQARSFSDPLPPAEPRPEERPISAAALAEYAGRYEVAPGVVASLSVVDQMLFIDFPGRGELELFFQGDDRFFAKAAPGRLTFERTQAGGLAGFSLEMPGRSLRASRLP